MTGHAAEKNRAEQTGKEEKKENKDEDVIEWNNYRPRNGVRLWRPVACS
jgi:hypothetical protein